MPYIPQGQSRNPDFQLIIPSAMERISEVEDLTEKVADTYHLEDDDRHNLAIAVTELVNNAIIHGNQFDPKKRVILSFYFDNDTLTVYIKDDGRGFDPKTVGNPLEPENLLKESGRGIFILRSIMDDVQFNFSDKGTEIKIAKKIKR